MPRKGAVWLRVTQVDRDQIVDVSYIHLVILSSFCLRKPDGFMREQSCVNTWRKMHWNVVNNSALILNNIGLGVLMR